MNYSSDLSDVYGNVFTGGLTILFALFVLLVFSVPIYVYKSLAWMTIASKLKYANSWLAWIPFGRTAMILQIGGFNWAFVFLHFIPFLGQIAVLILRVISMWRIYEKRGYAGALSLFKLSSLVSIIFGMAAILFSIANMVVVGIVAWSESTKEKPVPVPVPKPQ